MVSQHFSLVSAFTVAENIALGDHGGLVYDPAAAEIDVRAYADRYGMAVELAAPVGLLSVGEQQRVEILKALHHNARVLILDEPTAVLTPQEASALFSVLRRLVAEGRSVIFISHKLDEVLAIADRVIVLRDGRSVGETPTAGANAASLAEMMVGRPMSRVARGSGGSPGQLVLRLRDVHAPGNRGLPALRGVSLDVHAGEVLGIAGVAGNGQAELAEVVSGLRRPQKGQVLFDGRDLSRAGPAEVAAAGIGRIPEDRHVGVIGDLSVAENLALEHLGEYTRNGLLDRAKIELHARRLIAEYSIKARPFTLARTLSGGNMQKVILARVLDRRPKLVVAAEPSRGLDVAASEYVRDKLLEQRSHGAAVLLISEDLDEVLALSDRVAVLSSGQIVGTLPAAAATAEQLGLMMAGRRYE
jgi:simple sugar transport system ATP-binding protein